MGVDKPNYTQIPNLLLDDLMPHMGEAELKVTMAIARQTFGYHRTKIKLSISKLQELTGASRPTVTKGIQAGIDRGTIIRAENGDSFVYELAINDDTVSASKDSLLVKEVNQPSKESLPELVKNVYQNTPVLKKEKEREERKMPAPAAQLKTLPGVPKPRWRQEKRDADRTAKQRERLGLSAKEFTALISAVLTRMNALELADSDTDFGDEEFTQAQQTALALGSIGHKTLEAIDMLFDTWSTHDWRGVKGEAPTYKSIVEHAKTIGSKMQRQTAVTQQAVAVRRVEGEEW